LAGCRRCCWALLRLLLVLKALLLLLLLLLLVVPEVQTLLVLQQRQQRPALLLPLHWQLPELQWQQWRLPGWQRQHYWRLHALLLPGRRPVAACVAAAPAALLLRCQLHSPACLIPFQRLVTSVQYR
jgi:hypothetical protein